MHDAEYLHVLTIDVVDDEIITHREAACTCKQIVTGLTYPRVFGQKVEPACYGIDEAFGDTETAGLLGDVIHDVVEVPFGFQRKAMCHSTGRGLPCGQARSQALFRLLGERLHGFLRDDPPFTARNRSSCPVNARNQFRAQQLAFFP